MNTSSLYILLYPYFIFHRKFRGVSVFLGRFIYAHVKAIFERYDTNSWNDLW